MTYTVKHAFQSVIPDNSQALALGEVCPQAHWNAGHTIVGLSPHVDTSFPNAVANIPIIADYVFGSSAVAGPGQTAITNSTQLGTYFNPTEVLTGTVQVNNELQRYQPFSSAANFVFNSDNLQLTGTLDGGGSVTALVYGNTGSYSGTMLSPGFTPGNLGLSNLTGWAVGNIAVFTYNNIGVITSITGSGSSAVIICKPLLGSSGTFPTFVPFQIMPWYYAEASAPAAQGATAVSFAAVPAAVAAGQFMSFYDNTSNTANTSTATNSSQTFIVQSVVGNTVNFLPALNGVDAIATGQGIFFTPPIRSAQIWTKATFTMPGSGATAFAGELTIQLPQNAVPYYLTGNLSGAAATGANGGWPAWWIRGDFTNPDNTDALAEVDFGEWFNNILSTMKQWSPNLITAATGGSNTAGMQTPTLYLYDPPLWTVNGQNFVYNNATDFSLGYQRFQFYVSGDSVYWGVNDIFYKKTSFVWTSLSSPQMAVNLAIGSLLKGLCTNNLWPSANTNFNSMFLNIKRLTIRGL